MDQLAFVSLYHKVTRSDVYQNICVMLSSLTDPVSALLFIFISSTFCKTFETFTECKCAQNTRSFSEICVKLEYHKTSLLCTKT